MLSATPAAPPAEEASSAASAAPAPAIEQIRVPTATVSPSWTLISLRTPATGAGTSALTLSVMTSTSASYFSTASPGCFSQRLICPSVTLSPSWGMVTLVTPPTVCVPPPAI